MARFSQEGVSLTAVNLFADNHRSQSRLGPPGFPDGPNYSTLPGSPD